MGARAAQRHRRVYPSGRFVSNGQGLALCSLTLSLCVGLTFLGLQCFKKVLSDSLSSVKPETDNGLFFFELPANSALPVSPEIWHAECGLKQEEWRNKETEWSWVSSSLLPCVTLARSERHSEGHASSPRTALGKGTSGSCNENPSTRTPMLRTFPSERASKEKGKMNAIYQDMAPVNCRRMLWMIQMGNWNDPNYCCNCQLAWSRECC